MRTIRKSDLAELTLPRLDVTRPAAEQIFTAVKMAILRMDLPPDCLVSEKEIGQKVGASRTPVREAFTQLRQDGLIVTRPSRGNYVAKLSKQRIREAQFIREGLEINNIRRLCSYGVPPKHLDRLKNTLMQQEECIANADNVGFQTHDDLFHEALAKATGFDRAAKLLQREKVILDRLRILSLMDEERKTTLLKEHQAILDAVEKKDVERAVIETQNHLRSVLKDLLDLAHANHDYFE